MQKENKEQGPIFKNPILEKFTKSNPAITIFFYSGLICLFLVLNFQFTQNGIYKTLILYGGGLFIWTFMEYVLHRYVFHIDEYFPFLKRFHFIIHGIHHEYPRDHERLFMPPLPGTLIAAVLFLLWLPLFNEDTFGFMAGITNGYLFYSYIHYSVHTKPVFHPLRRLWKHHAMHHYKYQDKAYGVSSPLWDIIFGTMPPGPDKQRS